VIVPAGALPPVISTLQELLMKKALVIAGLVAMALIPLAQSFDLIRPRHTASVKGPAAAPVSSQDPVATAFDDLAAWPAAAGR
jgi:hypothetical protein